MFKRFARLLSAVGLGLVLSACDKPAEPQTEQSSLLKGVRQLGSQWDKKSSKEAYLEGYNQLGNKHAQYNFMADIKMDGTAIPDLPPDMKISLNGAVDMAQLKFELLPEVKAGVFQVKLPLAINLTEQSLMFDPSDIIATLQMFVPDAAPLVQRYNGKFVRFNLASLELEEKERKEMEQGIAFASQLMTAAFEAARSGYGELADNRFKQMDLDGTTAGSGIARAVSLNMDDATQKSLQKHMHGLFLSKLKDSPLLDELDDEIKNGFLQGFEEEMNYDEMPMASSDSIVYLDDKNRIVRINDRYSFDNEGEKIQFDVNMNISNHGKAVFALDASSGNIIDLDTDELETLKALLNN